MNQEQETSHSNRKQLRKDILKKKTRKDLYQSTRFDAACRVPYWDIKERNKAVTLPASASKRSALIERFRRFLSSDPDLPKDELSKICRNYRKLVVRQRKDYLKINVLLNIPSQAESGILSTALPYKHEYINCSFTDRILAPVIYQDFEIEPPLLKLHAELRIKVKEKFPNLELPKVKKYPVNYLYVDKDHIPVINALAKLHFWDGIDTSIALKYPEFSCVVTYRKIVIGFSFIAPGNHLNEAYINYLLVRPKWRNCGIGKMILYHLIQSCKTWDITLHVSPTNPALVLYHKFGFKSNLLLRQFYEMYAQTDSNESNHSFLMKLERSEIKPQ
ncbi:cysteine-rich protein 2-binding protein [Cimex lectularius]|uniref:N-acetyltransferase domain-containing protein n=1 Tax=Cimex lectularius TaxID=79782 RepID=A0A8I6SV68_CIMLE|nr:cysteine-rich protein 2-binding protein [Cimex lectularius]XP_024085641.1 cysteine-rich protein 2-binding protein [Cimex lectularius]XP_024085642.1 cysteine-rich protein 2-binding protein [Cimex lectularius]